MKKILFTFCVLLTIHNILNAQKYMLKPCWQYPTANTIYEQLANKPIRGFYPNFSIRCSNVNDSIKKRLLYLLEPTWTQAEIKRYVDSNILNDVYYKENLPRHAKKMSKNNDSLSIAS